MVLKVRSSLTNFLYETHGSVKLAESAVLTNHIDEDLTLSTCPFFQDVKLSVLSVGSLVKSVTDLTCYCWFQSNVHLAPQKQASKYPSIHRVGRDSAGRSDMRQENDGEI